MSLRGICQKCMQRINECVCLKDETRNNLCNHEWDKLTGKYENGIPHIGLKGKWVRTCTKCGHREVFSKGIFNGWFSE